MEKHRLPKFYGKLLLLFVTVCVLLVAFCYVIIYHYFLKTVKEEIEHSNTLMAAAFQNEVDYQIRAMDEIGRMLDQDVDFITLSDRNGYEYYRMENKLRSYATINQNLLDVAVLDNWNKTMLSASGNMSPEDYFGVFYRFLDWTPERMIQSLENIKEASFLGSIELKAYNTVTPKQAVLYVYPLISGRKVLFLMDEKFFDTCYKKHFGEASGGFYILSAENLPLLSIGKTVQSMGSFSLESREGNQFTFCESTYNNWSYCIFMENNDYNDRATAVQFIFWVTLILIMLLGLSLGVVFASAAYRPVRALRRSMGQLSGQEGSDNDEFSFISSHFLHMAQMNSQLGTQLEQDHQKYINTLMLSHLRGVIGFARMYELAGVGVVPSGSLICCVVLRTTEPKEALPESMLFPNVNCQYYFDDGLIILLLGVKCEMDSQTVIEAIAHRGKFLLGVGSILSDFTQIRVSFLQALTALAKADAQHPIQYMAMGDGPDPDVLVALADVRCQMMLTMKQADWEETAHCIGSFLDGVNPGIWRLVCSNLLSDLIMFARQNNCDIAHMESYLMTAENAPLVLRRQCMELAEKICVCIAQRKQDPEDRLRQQLLEYIDKNFRDPDLSVDKVAVDFGMSRSFLGRYFKAHSSSPLSSTIDERRMQAAREMLVQSEMQIKDIVASVGYVDVNNFIRKFKKREGIPPQQYRNKYKSTVR